jgi:UDP-glucose 4-epimerase
MENILITGAGPRAFVGRNLKEQLSPKNRYFAPTSEELDLLDLEATSEYIEKNHITSVIHSAAHNPRTREAEGELGNDLRMFFNLERLSPSLRKIIFFGSGAEFDKRVPIQMAKEEDFGIRIPVDYYGLAKYIMTITARKSANILNLRLFGIFGRYEFWQVKFISNLCCKAVFGLPLTVRQNCSFDFLYVDDLPAIVEWFMENEQEYQDYNACCGEPVDLVTIAETVERVSEKKLGISVLREGMNLPYTGDNARLRKQIPALHVTPLCDSIAALYRHYYDHRAEIDLDTLRDTK